MYESRFLPPSIPSNWRGLRGLEAPDLEPGEGHAGLLVVLQRPNVPRGGAIRILLDLEKHGERA